jgi:uncharacterized membrane protein YoaK (UPF0700 family)
MFQTEGAARSDAQNRVLAGYLSGVAGFVNSSGFLLLGTFTSHVTGNVGRLADDVALGDGSAAVLAAALVLAFFLGAFAASLVIEGGWVVRRSSASGLLLLAEAGLLLGFVAVVRVVAPTSPRGLDGAAALLCFAMGLQNSLVTRLSGAVVRTTHLTGVVTDLGIEAARWVRALRHRAGDGPAFAKTALLLTICASFVLGAGAGALSTLYLRELAMVVPALALVGGAGLAIRSVGGLDLPGARR